VLISGFNAYLEPMLYAVGKQKVRLRAMAAVALINVVLNGLLIPRYGYHGAIVATILSEAALLIVIYMALMRANYGRKLMRQIPIVAIAVCGFVLVLVGHLTGGTKLAVFMAAVCIFSVVIYAGRIVSKEDFRMLLAALRK
jgi:O-antigen/teichoic acid export membrane protein